MQNLSLFADLKVILATYWFGIDANFKIIPLAGNDGPTRRDLKKLLEGGDQLKSQNGEGETTTCITLSLRNPAVIRLPEPLDQTSMAG
jgi:hypothetical protein